MFSFITGKVTTLELDVTPDEIDNWQNGELIQKAMPRLTPEERDFILFGIPPEDWDKYLGEKPEA